MLGTENSSACFFVGYFCKGRGMIAKHMQDFHTATMFATVLDGNGSKIHKCLVPTSKTFFCQRETYTHSFWDVHWSTCRNRMFQIRIRFHVRTFRNLSNLVTRNEIESNKDMNPRWWNQNILTGCQKRRFVTRCARVGPMVFFSTENLLSKVFDSIEETKTLWCGLNAEFYSSRKKYPEWMAWRYETRRVITIHTKKLNSVLTLLTLSKKGANVS